MSLKCPFCGTKYFHDRKVCQKCENESINNINIPKNYTYVHYEKTTAFGRRKPDDFNLKYRKSQLKAIKEFSPMDLILFEKEKNYLLIYE